LRLAEMLIDAADAERLRLGKVDVAAPAHGVFWARRTRMQAGIQTNTKVPPLGGRRASPRSPLRGQPFWPTTRRTLSPRS
jgi:hypothetical protein